MWLDIARRTFAVIVLKVTGIFVGGAVIGLEVAQAVAMAAFAGIIDVEMMLPVEPSPLKIGRAHV